MFQIDAMSREPVYEQIIAKSPDALCAVLPQIFFAKPLDKREWIWYT